METQDQCAILTISLARHLVGHGINHVLEKAWIDPEVPASILSRFTNVGFDLSVDDTAANLKELKKVLSSQQWNGIILGWCVRGHVEFTELFETVVAVCVDHISETRAEVSLEPKLIFCRGPDDLVNATLRNFPST
ncbi:hypothetical protein HIM_04385 [Hirsutella minnesotensis 3608]|uniref:Uncharacterized protein n=1 Tax=Hirsutella minnesotensis 3608 TaxID=1043627 RepID=A0A0F7ZVB1_9HYPO|nr:hypothetical protein HIM_04385 [Hirsutella minnesotensis 3608]